MHIIRSSVLSLALLISTQLFAQNEMIYEPKEYISQEDTLLYRVLWPEKFKKKKKYPLVLFLHGSGERGNDNKKQLIHGSKLFLDNRKEFPAIVVFPQCPEEDYWSNVNRKEDSTGHKQFNFTVGQPPTHAMEQLMSLMDSLTQLSFVDQKRVYVMGLSMGGMGTFEIISRKPDMFAAAVPICGGARPETAKNFASKVNLWVFHGAKDDVVPPQKSEVMVEAIKKANGNVKFTLYPNANHNSWDSTFAEPNLLPWLFSNTK